MVSLPECIKAFLALNHQKMLICGIANPTGEGESYNGLHLKDSEIDEIIQGREMVGLPVKIEHKGVGIGKVVSAFKDREGRLNCVMELSPDEVEGAIAQEWVRDSTASELSLGYVVDINQSGRGEGERLRAGKKKVLEVSIVRKGARQGCKIYGGNNSKSNAFPVPSSSEILKDWGVAFGL